MTRNNEPSSAQLVIVGAGTAGCAVARRVTERTDRSVLLIESGPDYQSPGVLPSDLADGTRNSMVDHDWKFLHRPNPRQVVFRFPRGRVVGGSSAVNTCIALRGQAYDYNEWADLGLPEWSWEKCLPAFKRLENDLDFQNEWHGESGPLPLRRHPKSEWVPWQSAFVDACLDWGFPYCHDSNHPDTHGVGPHTMNKINGRRISIAEAYLDAKVRRRENLQISPNTDVNRVLFRQRRVVGIEVVTRTERKVIPTNRVVLSAGAIQTPHILVRSGVGPAAVLERLGVDVESDLKGVGARLLDHPGAAIFFRPTLFSPLRRRHPLIQTVLRCSSGMNKHINDLLLQPGSTVPAPGMDLPMGSLMCAIGKPKGSGYLEFHSTDLRARPKIHSRILSHPDDRKAAVDALLLAYQLFQQSRLSRFGQLVIPHPWVMKKRTRLERFVWYMCGSGYHPCGTAPMGVAEDPMAVTDQKGKVRGLEGLYIADASLMPTIPSSNINIPTLMMGERIGEWLRDENLNDL